MKRIVVRCQCSALITTIEEEDWQNGLTLVETNSAECAECSANGGQYSLSSHWKETQKAEYHCDEEDRDNYPQPVRRKKR